MGRISALTRRFSLRFLEYWKNIGSDYKAVCIDIISDSKKKPLKSAAIGAALAALAYAYKTNPNERFTQRNCRPKKKENSEVKDICAYENRRSSRCRFITVRIRT
ncbi:hypothetical protein Tcan_17618 [Toxocara canis]|uniref:Uncharacterized protein n=1 Tax=Toxocara canis TaxID=6265 RepID=A0A0B2VEH9_TOXCA|nr:hypothetical protein Tcan_17618 [Toxocara canis]